MRLLRVHIIEAQTCGGLLDGMDVWLRSPAEEGSEFEPLCLIGPNGSGKSQFLQIIAEIFQSILFATIKRQERSETNSDLQFEVDYLIRTGSDDAYTRVRAARKAEGKRRPRLEIEKKVGGEKRRWI